MALKDDVRNMKRDILGDKPYSEALKIVAGQFDFSAALWSDSRYYAAQLIYLDDIARTLHRIEDMMK